MNREVFIELPVQRVECLECASVRQVNIPFTSPKRSYTKRFERYAWGLFRHMTIQDVVRHPSVGWDTIDENLFIVSFWERTNIPGCRKHYSLIKGKR